jgi:hypothetical protein
VTTAADVVRIAYGERGYVETPNNITKYGKAYENGWANGQAWCATFVSWVFAQAGMPIVHYAGCTVGVANFKNGNWGSWHGPHEATQAGDIVFYGRAGGDHTGIVWSASPGGASIHTIEGNTSSGVSGSQTNGGGVYERTRDRSWVFGFGRPKYSPAAVPANPKGDDMAMTDAQSAALVKAAELSARAEQVRTVSACYRDICGRAASDTDMAAFIKALDGGLDIGAWYGQVVRAFKREKK